jgi:hypothetical protein
MLKALSITGYWTLVRDSVSTSLNPSNRFILYSLNDFLCLDRLLFLDDNYWYKTRIHPRSKRHPPPSSTVNCDTKAGKL